MRKIIVFAHLLAGATFVLNSFSAFASDLPTVQSKYASCPNDWNLTLTPALPEMEQPPFPKEFSPIIGELGGNVAIEQVGIQVPDSKGGWIAFRGGDFYRLSYALSGKQYKIIYRVSKLGCSQSTLFSAVGNFPDFPLRKMDINDYLNSSTGLYVQNLNFLQKNEISKNLNLCAQELIKTANTAGTDGNSLPFGYNLRPCQMASSVVEMQFSFHQAECLHYTSDYKMILKPAEVCDVSLVFGVVNVLDVKLIGPKKISSPSPSRTVSATRITCVKGKVTKTVIAIKPVCPSGYIRK
jgi:hypothetical protein